MFPVSCLLGNNSLRLNMTNLSPPHPPPPHFGNLLETPSRDSKFFVYFVCHGGGGERGPPVP